MPCIRYGAWLLFLSCYNTTTYKRLQRVLCRQCNYTAYVTKQRTRLYRGFSCNCTHSAAANNKPIQAAIIPPVQCWSVSQRRSASSTYQIPEPRRTLYRSAQPPYYNKVYKSAPPCYRSMPDGAAYRRPCQPGGVSMLPTPGISLAPGCPGISLALCFLPGRGGAELLAAVAVSLFGLAPDN